MPLTDSFKVCLLWFKFLNISNGYFIFWSKSYSLWQLFFRKKKKNIYTKKQIKRCISFCLKKNDIHALLVCFLGNKYKFFAVVISLFCLSFIFNLFLVNQVFRCSNKQRWHSIIDGINERMKTDMKNRQKDFF